MTSMTNDRDLTIGEVADYVKDNGPVVIDGYRIEYVGDYEMDHTCAACLETRAENPKKAVKGRRLCEDCGGAS